MIRLLLLSGLALAIACGEKSSDDEDDDDAEDSGDPNDPPFGGDGDGGDGADGDDGSDGGDGDDGSDGGDDSGDDGSDTFTPASGHWTVTGGSVIYDNCDYEGDDELPGSEGDGWMLSMSDTTTFTKVFDLTGDSTTCTITGEQDYSCTTLTGSEGIDDLDVTISSSVEIGGSFLSETSISGEWMIWIDCSGGDCWLAEAYTGIDFPCDVQVSVQASADGG